MSKVTILKTAQPCNKKWDGKKMTFGKPFTSAQATTCMVNTIGDVFNVIKSISEDTNLTWTPGGYFPAYKAHKEQFNIMAGTTMRKSLDKQDISGVQSIDGIDYIARLKTNMLPSCVQLFDYDMSDAMPTKYQNMSTGDLVGFMRSIFGEDVGFVVTESTSGRVEGLGNGKGYHLYAIVNDPSDLERFKGAWLAQGFLPSNGWSFLKPTYCKKDNPARGLLVGDVCAYVPWSLFDPSVLASCERLDFIGKPYSPENNPKINPAQVKLYEGGHLDTSIIKSIEPEQRKQIKQTLKAAGITLTGDGGFVTSVVGGINLDDEVETQGGWMTIKDFISSSHEKLRCQVPLHIRDSESWNGILRMTEKGTAMLYDNGTRTSYFLPDVEVAKIEDANNEWDKPEPFNVTIYPPLPSVKDMPPALWEIVSYAADQAGTNTSFSFASGLSTLAGVCRGLVYVARKDGSIKNLATVFTINAALSGEGKSATRGMIDKPLREIAKNLKSECAKDTAKWKTQANAAKMQIRVLEKSLAEEGRDMSALEEVSNMNHMQLIATPPISGLAIYSQTTPEAFIEKCGTDGFVMLATDEGSAVVEGFGRYSNQSGADMSPVLKAFDGSDDNVARRKDNSYGGALKGCLDLSVQPSVLNRIVGDDEMRSRGFINRFIMMVTPTTAGTLNYHKRPLVDKGVEERWRKVVMGINTMVSDLGDGTKTILLSDAADSLHSEYANSYQARVGEDGDLEEMKDLYSRRHPAYVMRIAAFYHLIMGGTLDSKITTETMQYAMKTGELVAAHYQAVVGNAGTPEVSLAHKVLKKIAKTGLQQISVRDMYKKGWSKITSPDDAKAILDTLTDMGWAREVIQPPRRGKPPSPLFELHPDYVIFLSYP